MVSVDTTAPVINCIEDIIETIELGEAGGTVTWVEPTAVDNSGTATLASRTRVPDSFFNIGISPVTYVFIDPSNNQASCTFNVVVETSKFTDM